MTSNIIEKVIAGRASGEFIHEEYEKMKIKILAKSKTIKKIGPKLSIELLREAGRR